MDWDCFSGSQRVSYVPPNPHPRQGTQQVPMGPQENDGNLGGHSKFCVGHTNFTASTKYFQIWCDFDRASSLIQYVEIKCQLDATEVFIADLIACSTCFGHHYAHHQELKSIIGWLLPVLFRAVVFKLLVWCGAEGYVSGLQDAGLLFRAVVFKLLVWCGAEGYVSGLQDAGLL